VSSRSLFLTSAHCVPHVVCPSRRPPPSPSQPFNLCDIEQATSVSVAKEDGIYLKVDISVKDPDKEVRMTLNSSDRKNCQNSHQTISLSLEERDAEELILVLGGYYRLLTEGRELEVTRQQDSRTQEIGEMTFVLREEDAPSAMRRRRHHWRP